MSNLCRKTDSTYNNSQACRTKPSLSYIYYVKRDSQLALSKLQNNLSKLFHKTFKILDIDFSLKPKYNNNFEFLQVFIRAIRRIQRGAKNLKASQECTLKECGGGDGLDCD